MSQTNCSNASAMNSCDTYNQPVAARTRRLSNSNGPGTATQADNNHHHHHQRHYYNKPGIKFKSMVPRSKSNVKRDLSCGSPPQAAVNNLSKIDDHRILDEITKAYEKNVAERTEEDTRILADYAFLIPTVEAAIKSRLAKAVLKQRVVEFEESCEMIREKSNTLAQLIKQAGHVVIYTGAGISTSASIPDYRGPNGLWTQIRRTGSFSITKIHDLSQAEPTFTHMAIKELCRRRVVKHVVSQNCDGLHLRSGIPQSNLSDIHGNMYIEVCPSCERQYFRQADITERTSRFRHKTGRKCHDCVEPSNNNLIDTIVLFGERSRSKWPMNWDRASKAAKRADLIICMGTSLKTLRRYHCLWPKSIGSAPNISNSGGSGGGSSKREFDTKLVIINLQYTPKDKNAVLKINGKCDLVMQLVMQKLNIQVPQYDWTSDPLLALATPFTVKERAELRRNLIFESKQVRQQCGASKSSSDGPLIGGGGQGEMDSRSSPSLFVSELTDDPERKHLKMRIRAVNVGATGSCEPPQQTIGGEDGEPQLVIDSSTGIGASIANDRDADSITNEEEEGSTLDEEDNENERAAIKKIKLEYSLPGWLGKSLGSNKSSSYRRKRHGNKGRKHSSSTTTAMTTTTTPTNDTPATVSAPTTTPSTKPAAESLMQ